MKRTSKRTLKISTVALAFLGLSTQAFAASMYIYEMIPTEVGTAGAGSAAHTKDGYHYGIATQYQFDENLMLSAGFSFDSQLQYTENRSISTAVERYVPLRCRFRKKDE